MKEPDLGPVNADAEQQPQVRTDTDGFSVSAPRPAPRLNRGFDAYSRPARHSSSALSGAFSSPDTGAEPTLPYAPVSRRDRYDSAAALTEATSGHVRSNDSDRPGRLRERLGWLWPWRKREALMSQSPSQRLPLPTADEGLEGVPLAYADEAAVHEGYPVTEVGALPVDSSGTDGCLVRSDGRTYRRRYGAIAYFFLMCGAFTAAWLLGILAAQAVPGRFERLPFQERFLRKSSRLADRFWHLPQLGQTPINQIKIEAIPLPETGPISRPLALSPIERQPLIDELNAIDTELLTLDRRLAGIEKRLGNSAYQGADLEHRINSLRAAIDPPVRRSAERESDAVYEPVAMDPNASLLAVAKFKITLPSDALFTPGQADLKSADLSAGLLEQVLDQLVNYPGATVSVRSYSDNQVGAIASREYTLAQAHALVQYLARALPDDYRWISVGMGSSQPALPNDDAVGRQKNRRIEILVDVR